MTEKVKDALIKALIMIIVAFAIGIIIGQAIRNVEQERIISELETQLQDTQEQLLISNDQLRQIEMHRERKKIYGE